MLAPHVGVMSAAAFGDLPAVTTVGRSVGTFRGITIFVPNVDSQKLESRSCQKKCISRNSNPRSHSVLSSGMTWRDI